MWLGRDTACGARLDTTSVVKVCIVATPTKIVNTKKLWFPLGINSTVTKMMWIKGENARKWKITKSLSNTILSTAQRIKALSRREQRRRRYLGASSEKFAISAAEVSPRAGRDQDKTRLFESLALVLESIDITVLSWYCVDLVLFRLVLKSWYFFYLY